ncbi:hypothetical protein Bca52824_028665 [Brassica carinata]|uniref:Uncharacterized protein n=1 Tax=Brassica carinata TaxID=52824 RepID=A0A8X8AQI3_BRACI|nr:hypothetical protein Bca52824_028665 [Brassica carinata]
MNSDGSCSGTHMYGVSEEEEEAELWREMAFAQESSSQVTVENSQYNEFKQKEECEHSFIYRDDTGEVCCVCGLINRHIARMIEFVFNKSGDSSESDVSPQGYNDNGTHMYGVVSEEEEVELWREMELAQDSSSQVTVEESKENDFKQIDDDCDHSFIYKDDIGEVCCVCGLIKTPIASIIEVVFNKDMLLL